MKDFIKKIIDYLFKRSLDSKDPKDYTKCRLSTNWHSDDHYCSACRRSTGHNEYMSDICNGCGSFKTQELYGRSYRQIYIDGKWKYQIKYKNGADDEIIEKWYN
jgi:hypothetical protein